MNPDLPANSDQSLYGELDLDLVLSGYRNPDEILSEVLAKFERELEQIREREKKKAKKKQAA